MRNSYSEPTNALNAFNFNSEFLKQSRGELQMLFTTPDPCGFGFVITRKGRIQMRWQNIPSRNFGSNHVLLGGMIPPASAMVIKSSMLVGNMLKAHA